MLFINFSAVLLEKDVAMGGIYERFGNGILCCEVAE